MATHSLTGRHVLPVDHEAEYLREHGCTPAPRFVQWMATLSCGLSCPHCLADDGRPAAPDMPLPAVARLLDQVAAMGIPEFLVTGGEPAARPDLPEVVELLRERGIRWTLNTAANPGARLRAAMERHPPAFVAVSLDGPEPVHDAFRGRSGAFRDAVEAIRFYLSIVPGRRVTAGTTVTARNWGSLPETFATVVNSGATAWGLHLLVPEGRAARVPGLFLSRRQLRGLVDFCASRRKYFPVGMADEIGHLGPEEPLVRDWPFFCGAGRTQCVVLPGGEVVPCTTLDRSTGAGNVLERPLAGIWAEGFAELRRWEPRGRCRSCEYAPACRGGCWLQRRAGTQCFRPVWRPGRLARAAAAAALFAAGAAGARAGEPEGVGVPRVEGEEDISDIPLGGGGNAPGEDPAERQRRVRKSAVETVVLSLFLDQHRLRREGLTLRGSATAAAEIGGDPAMVYVTGLLAPERSRALAERGAAIRAGLRTEQVSLSLAALMWRDLAECCLDGKPPESRSPEDRRALRETLATLASTSAEWRRRTFTEKLGEFIGEQLGVGGGGMAGFGYKSGGGRRREPEARAALIRERWGELSAVSEEYLREHRFGESMDLPVRLPPGHRFVLAGPGQADGAAPASRIAVFDVLTVPGRPGDAPVKIGLTDGEELIEVALPAGAELAHADLLGLAHAQHRHRLLNSARRVLADRSWDRSRPLLLPALRELVGDAAPPDSQAESARIAALVVQLGHDDWEKREAASGALAEMGGLALRELHKAVDSPDPEVADRALRLLEAWSPADRLDSDQVGKALAMFWMF